MGWLEADIEVRFGVKGRTLYIKVRTDRYITDLQRADSYLDKVTAAIDRQLRAFGDDQANKEENQKMTFHDLNKVRRDIEKAIFAVPSR